MTNLRQIREERKMKADDVAYLSRVSSVQYNRLERGDSTPRLDTAMRIARVLNANIYDLYEV